MPKQYKKKHQAPSPTVVPATSTPAPVDPKPQPNTPTTVATQVRAKSWAKMLGFGVSLAAIMFVLIAILIDDDSNDIDQDDTTLDLDSLEDKLLAGNIHPGIFSFSNRITRENLSEALAFADQRYSNGETYPFSKSATKVLEKHAPKFLKGDFADAAEYTLEFEKAVASVQGIYALEQSVLETNLCDVANGRLTYKHLTKFLKKSPLSTLTAPEFVNLIRGINAQLQAPCAKDIGFTKLAPYVQGPMVVSPIGTAIYDEAACIKFLRINDPDMIPSYEKIVAASKKSLPGISLKMQMGAWALLSSKTASANDPSITQFLDKYFSISYGNNIPQDLLNLAKKILSMLQKGNVDPYTVAAVVHQGIVTAHAFEDGNGRTARALASAVLLSQERKPLIFSSNVEYNDQVVRYKRSPSDFAKYLREVDREYPRTLTFYRSIQDCVDTKKSTICMQLIKDTQGDLLQCDAESPEATCLSNDRACSYTV